MSKHHSLVELLSSNNDNSRQDKFQMKTKICPHLPHLQTTKKNVQRSFPILWIVMQLHLVNEKITSMLDINVFKKYLRIFDNH